MTLRSARWILLLLAVLAGPHFPAVADEAPLSPKYSAAHRGSLQQEQREAPTALNELAAQGATRGSAGENEKTTANGLTMAGSWLANWVNGSATINLGRINNDSATRTTGTMRLELWASSSAPARAQPFTGYRLFTSAVFNPLSPQTYYYDIVRSGTFTAPPNGSYWMVLVLAEFDSVNCSAADHYCITDSANSYAQEVFGTPPPGSSYTDIWWNPLESGWGVTITHHASGNAFIAWYTYDSLGLPYWYVASNCQMVGNSCTATLYETRGPPFGPTFNPAAVTAQSVGTISFTFTGSNYGIMSYNVRGSTATKLITRQGF